MMEERLVLRIPGNALTSSRVISLHDLNLDYLSSVPVGMVNIDAGTNARMCVWCLQCIQGTNSTSLHCRLRITLYHFT